MWLLQCGGVECVHQLTTHSTVVVASKAQSILTEIDKSQQHVRHTFETTLAASVSVDDMLAQLVDQLDLS